MTEGKVWQYPDFVRLFNTSTPLRSVELSKKWRKSGFHGQGLTRLSCDALRFLGMRKPLLVRFCVVVWVFFSVFSIFCITSFADCTRPQQQSIVWKVEIILQEKMAWIRSQQSLDLDQIVSKKVSIRFVISWGPARGFISLVPRRSRLG